MTADEGGWRLRRPRLGALALTALSFVLCVGCRERATNERSPPPPSSAAEAPKPTSQDRLPPGALVEGSDSVFGLQLPRAAKIDARFAKSVHVSGLWSTTDLGDYLRERVAAAHVEVADGRLVFPRARIRGGDGRIFRFEIIDEGTRRRLVIDDVTPRPRVEGISEAERWRRAGLTPDGKLANEKDLE